MFHDPRLDDADWLVHRYDEKADQWRLRHVPRDVRERVPFLVDDYLPAAREITIARHQAPHLRDARPVHFLFHSAFCCSTLAGQCFDRPGGMSLLSEPVLLNDMAGLHLRGMPTAKLQTLIAESLNILPRAYPNDVGTLIKPSNVVNALAGALMLLRPESKAILMHAPLRRFLTSIAKKGLDGHLWVRELFIKQLRQGLPARFGFSEEAFFGQTDLQIAAIGWLSQQALFGDLEQRFPDRIMRLDSETFLADPAAAIHRGVTHFGLPESVIDVDHIQVITARDSKTGDGYSRDRRDQDYAVAEQARADEIGKVCYWAAQIAEQHAIAVGN